MSLKEFWATNQIQWCKKNLGKKEKIDNWKKNVYFLYCFKKAVFVFVVNDGVTFYKGTELLTRGLLCLTKGPFAVLTLYQTINF